MSIEQGTGLAVYDGSDPTPERPPGKRANKRYWEGRLHGDTKEGNKAQIIVRRNSDTAQDASKGTEVVAVGPVVEDDEDNDIVVPDGTASELSRRGDTLFKRAKRSGKLDDLSQAVATLRKAVSLTPKGDTNYRSRQSNLGTALKTRFKNTGRVRDIDEAIMIQKEAVIDFVGPDTTKALTISNLGSSLYARYAYTRSVANLEESIKQLEIAVELGGKGSPPDDQIMFLNSLGNALVDRFEDLGNASDMQSALSNFDKALKMVTAQTDSADISTVQANFGAALRKSFEHRGRQEDLTKAIALQKEAESRIPGHSQLKANRLINLAITFKIRYEYAGNVADIDEAISLGTRAVALTPDSETIRKPEYLNSLGNFYRQRFQQLRVQSDIDEAVSAHTKAVALAPDSGSMKSICLASLGATYNILFASSDNLDHMEAAIVNLRQAKERSSNQGRTELAITLNELGTSLYRRFERVGNMPDLEEAISLQEQCLDMTSDKDIIRPFRLQNLSMMYSNMFETTGLLEDLDKGINYEEDALNQFPEGNAKRCILMQHLGNLYKLRFERFGDNEDALRSLRAYRGAATLNTGSSTIRFDSARSWAALAQEQDTDNVLAAYEVVIHLIPRVVWLGTTISTRYNEISWIGDTANEAAAAAIAKGQYKHAVEWLEQGRSLIWNQILQLRTPVDELRLVDPPLAERFVQVSAELESAGNAEALSGQTSTKQSTTVEEITQKHRRLAEEWEQLVQKIRAIPLFESFLQPKKLEELVKATASGPVVLVNVHRQRCDALVIRADSSVTAVPLSVLSYTNVLLIHGAVKNELKGTGVISRGSKVSYDTGAEGGIGRALGLLWKALVKPVLDSLQYERKKATSIDLPYITWCVTGLLAFLPIHAAGLYDEDELEDDKLFEYAVSSYTPTLTSLINSEKQIVPMTPSILAISQPATPGQNPLGSTVLEVESIRQHANAMKFTWLNGPQATVEEVLTSMAAHSWIHLACHASQRTEAPMHSAFFLQNGDLRLSTIMEKSFKHTDLAFLSACQTASGDEKRPEEAFHLAAGMIMAGYRTVLATMWSIRDIDGPVIADSIYARLLADDSRAGGKRNAAYALHQAVAGLRDSIGEEEFVAWVPFIHIGV